MRHRLKNSILARNLTVDLRNTQEHQPANCTDAALWRWYVLFIEPLYNNDELAGYSHTKRDTHIERAQTHAHYHVRA